MTKMKPAVKKKWLAALRSGEYKQGKTGQLKDEKGGYCCLGVLCDVYAKTKRKKGLWQGFRFMNESAFPAQQVWEWAGLGERNPNVKDGSGKTDSLAEFNDGEFGERNRRNFKQIANYIEKSL